MNSGLVMGEAAWKLWMESPPFFSLLDARGPALPSGLCLRLSSDLRWAFSPPASCSIGEDSASLDVGVVCGGGLL